MESGLLKCKDCQGKGTWFLISDADKKGMIDIYSYKCNKCRGKGVIDWVDNITRKSDVRTSFMFDTSTDNIKNLIKKSLIMMPDESLTEFDSRCASEVKKFKHKKNTYELPGKKCVVVGKYREFKYV